MRIGHRAETVGRERRRRRLYRVDLIMLSVVLTLAGCAHEQAYKRGNKLSEQHQYERAIEELESAVALAEERHNTKAADRYREKLDQVKQEASQFYYRDAEIRFRQADLGAAQSLIERCVTYCPQEQTYWWLRKRILQAIGDAEKLRTEALSLAQERQWQSAVQRMNEALSLYKTMPGGEADLKQIKDRAYQYHVGRAQDGLQQDDLESADAEARVALGYQTGGREANAVLQTVTNRREAAGLIAHGRTLLDQGTPEEALNALERAQRLHPSHAELPELLARARRALCDRWLEQGRRAMEAHDYPAALHLFRKSNNLLGGYGAVDALLADAASRLAEVHLEQSQRYQQEGAYGCAVLHAVAALGYQPDSFDARRQLGQCAEPVRREVGYTIAFVGFRAGSHPAQQSLAAMLDAAALEHLTRTHPANVTLVERADLRAILDEQGFNMTERVDPQFRVPTGKLRGVDALIVGQILDGKVTMESKRTGHGESTYQDGYRPEPNPEHVQAVAEFDAAMEELEHARITLAEAEARLARFKHVDPADAAEMARKRKAQMVVDEAKQRLVNAAAGVGTAKLRVVAIPPEVLVPNIVAHEYPIQTFTKTASVHCMLKMLDTATGEVLVAERLEGQHRQADRLVSGDPYRNVLEDPLELPNDGTMLEAAAKATMGKLKQALDLACTKHGERFAVAMRQAEASGDTVQALDCCVKYLFAYPGGHTHTNHMADFLRTYLGPEDGLVDVRALLRTHCQVLLGR